MNLPGHQVRKGKPRPAALCMQPDAKGMQGHLCRHTGLQPAAIMGPFPLQAEGMLERLVPSLPSRASPRHPATEPLGPRRLARPLGRAEDLGPLGLPPHRMVRPSVQALVDAIRPPGRRPHTRELRVGLAAPGKEGRRQRGLFGTRRPTAKASDPSDGGDGQQQVASCIPAQPVALADRGQPGHPAGPTPLGIPRGNARALQGCVEPALGGPAPAQRQNAGHQGSVGLAPLPMQLLPGGHLRKGRPQVARCLAIQAALTATALPWPDDSHGHHLAAAQRGRRSRRGLGGQSRLAKIVDHDVKNRPEGVHINQRRCS